MLAADEQFKASSALVEAVDNPEDRQIAEQHARQAVAYCKCAELIEAMAVTDDQGNGQFHFFTVVLNPINVTPTLPIHE